jgi:hypothetical protein
MATVGSEVVAVNLTSWRIKSSSSIARDIECSGQLKGSHSDKPRGRGRDGGGGLRISGSTIDAHEEWMPIMIRHELEIVSPWVGNVVSVEERHQPVDLSDVENDLTHLPL